MFKPSRPLAAFIISLFAVALLLEGASRLVYAFRDDIERLPVFVRLFDWQKNLDPYEMPSPKGGHHWVLRPGYVATMAKFVADKKRTGRMVGVRALFEEDSAKKAPNDIVFRINSQGFKGAELSPQKGPFRILAAGDSTTFGLGVIDYPKILQQILNRTVPGTEVVNAGAEGYTVRNLLLEMDTYKALKPDLAIIFIGWNSLYGKSPVWLHWEQRLRTVWLAGKVSQAVSSLFGDDIERATGLYERPLKPDPNDPDVRARLSHPSPLSGPVEKLIGEFEKNAIPVALVTLPGLFTSSLAPSPEALKKGHLPAYTDNPYLFSAMTEQYNEALRQIASKRKLILIDLERWSASALQPRHKYFSDAVHLNKEGLLEISSFMAKKLLPAIEGRVNQKRQ